MISLTKPGNRMSEFDDERGTVMNPNILGHIGQESGSKFAAFGGASPDQMRATEGGDQIRTTLDMKSPEAFAVAAGERPFWDVKVISESFGGTQLRKVEGNYTSVFLVAPGQSFSKTWTLMNTGR